MSSIYPGRGVARPAGGLSKLRQDSSCAPFSRSAIWAHSGLERLCGIAIAGGFLPEMSLGDPELEHQTDAPEQAARCGSCG
ncbi:MAG: hypothetical protein QOD29_3919 [Alphaproteobacteria bacterium]|jgi:hypothetical protein|nr:hypothetical protein [Alphaproteobacteria bacterium]